MTKTIKHRSRTGTPDAYHTRRIENMNRAASLDKQGFDPGEIAEKIGLSRRYVLQLLSDHQNRVILRRQRAAEPETAAPNDVAHDPACQELIKRLGEQVSDINSASIDRCQYVLGVASVVRAARLR